MKTPIHYSIIVTLDRLNTELNKFQKYMRNELESLEQRLNVELKQGENKNDVQN